jgi:diguanylate cyclase (GGDEF)-like protein
MKPLKLSSTKKYLVMLWCAAISLVTLMLCGKELSALETSTHYTAQQLFMVGVGEKPRSKTTQSSLTIFLNLMRDHGDGLYSDSSTPIEPKRITFTGLVGNELKSVTLNIADIYHESISESMTFIIINFVLLLLGFKVIYSYHNEKEKEKSIIYHMAYHDSLTDLPNRRAMYEHIKISTAKKRSFAVILIDLDGFKGINDTLGHNYGDVVLKEISKRLCSCVRGSDVVSRIGGDEFIIVLNGLSNRVTIEDICKKIIRITKEPFNLQKGTGVLHSVSASVGVSIYPNDSDKYDSLIKFADIAMYNSKNRGKNTYTFYSECAEASKSIIDLEQSLKACTTAFRGFSMHYQPIIDIRTKHMYAAEALVRWRVDGRFINPETFINVAETIGVMRQLGNYILDTSIRQLAIWNSTIDPMLAITINASVKQFNGDFCGKLAQVMAKYGVNPSNVIIEVTESIFLEEAQLKILQRIQGYGCKIAIDDFGTGYSSLSYLKKFPVDIIKIDKFFINDCETPENTALIQAIVALSKVFGYRVIAEGIETKNQENVLLLHGCQYGQGYLFAKPMATEKFEEFYENMEIA